MPLHIIPKYLNCINNESRSIHSLFTVAYKCMHLGLNLLYQTTHKGLISGDSWLSLSQESLFHVVPCLAEGLWEILYILISMLLGGVLMQCLFRLSSYWEHTNTSSLTSLEVTRLQKTFWFSGSYNPSVSSLWLSLSLICKNFIVEVSVIPLFSFWWKKHTNKEFD